MRGEQLVVDVRAEQLRVRLEAAQLGADAVIGEPQRERGGVGEICRAEVEIELDPRESFGKFVESDEPGAIRALRRPPGEALALALVDDVGLPVARGQAVELPL